MYHVMSRGNPPSPGYGGTGRRAKIFLDDVDRQDFIKTLAEACQKTQGQVHADCLMPNHYPLVLETPEPNLVAGMAWRQSTYTIRLNHRHKLTGHVLRGRYKAQLVGDGFKRDLRLRMAGRLGEHHAGALQRAAAVARAEQILEAELERRHWTKRDLKERRKNDAEKLAIAARLRRETTLSIKDIAALVHLGTSKGANANLHRHLRENPPSGPKPKAAARQAKDG